MYNKTVNFLENEFRINGFMLVLMTFTVTFFLCTLYNALFLGLPQLSTVWMFSIAILSFASIPVVYVMGVASNSARDKSMRHDLMVVCLTKISQTKNSIKPGQTVVITSGYSNYYNEVRDVVEALQDVIDPKFILSSSGCNGPGPYRIKLRQPKRISKPFI